MHFADTHFGVELYGRLDAESGLNTRLLDFRRSLTAAIDAALEQGVDLALFAGDAYKTRDPRQTDQREFAGCIRRLTDKGVPVVLLTGNHDMPAIKGRAHAVEIYRTLGVSRVTVVTRPELLTLETPAGPVHVAGMPYLLKGITTAREEFQGKSLDETRHMLEDLYARYLDDLAAQAESLNDDAPRVLLGHFWVAGARLSDWQRGYLSTGEPQAPLSAVANSVWDYVALGHIHRHQDLQPQGRPHVVYSGSPDRIDFGERDEIKGFVMVDLQRGDSKYRFVPVEVSRPLLDIQVDADCEEPTEAILRAIRRQPLEEAIVRLAYRIGHERVGQVREREVREALAQAFMVVSITRKVERDAAARSQMLTESRTPREALELYIDTRDNLKPHKAKLLEAAEPLFLELAEAEGAV